MVDQNLLKSIQAIVGAEANRHVQEFCGKIKKEVQHATANDECTDMMNALWGDGAYGNRLTCSSSWLKLHEMVQSVKVLGVPKGRLFSASGNKTDDHFAALNAPNFKVRKQWMEVTRPMCCNKINAEWCNWCIVNKDPTSYQLRCPSCFSPPSCSVSSSLFPFLFLSSLPFLLATKHGVLHEKGAGGWDGSLAQGTGGWDGSGGSWPCNQQQQHVVFCAE